MKQSSTTLKQEELLNTQKNAEDNHKENSTLNNRERIKGTPFTLIKEENNYFLVMGDWRITEPTETKKETLEKLETEKWLILMHMVIIAIQKAQENPIIQDME